MRRTVSNAAHINRPFDPAVLTRAAVIASTYTLVIEPSDDVGYLGRTVELPFAMSDGKTVATCAKRVIEATVLAIATMLECDEGAPTPARDARR